MGYFVIVLLIVLVCAAIWKTFQVNAVNASTDRSKAVLHTFRTGTAYAAPILVVLVTVWNMAYQVPAGHAGIVYSFGGLTGQRSEGLQWVWPWQEIKNASIQVQGRSFAKLDTFSKETQDVFVASTINTRVSPQNIQTLYRDVGANYFEVLVQPRVLQALKDETVKYSAVDIAPNREKIRISVRERLTNELKAYSITVEDFLVDNIAFRPAFQAAIETKQGNVQLALAEEQLVAARRYQADQAIETARGQAESILINARKQAEANRELSASITPEYIQYIFASRLAPNVSVMMVPSGQQFIMGADMMKMQQRANTQ